MHQFPTSDESVAAAWRAHRRRVLDVCYRMLGTLADAEDAVQETYARLTRHGTGDIDDTVGWLVTVPDGCALTGCALTRPGATTSVRGYLNP